MTRARGAVIERSAMTARSARCSWKKPIAALTITIAPIAIASSSSPRDADNRLQTELLLSETLSLADSSGSRLAAILVALDVCEQELTQHIVRLRARFAR